jgi:ABC-2 type transport system permease protein
MHKILLILQKEWIEIRQQPILLMSMILPPLIFTALPLIVFTLMRSGVNGSMNAAGNIALNYPALASMSPTEAMQTIIGMQFSILYVLLPGLLTSIIASYSIIGEKTSRTLEPLLATPIRTWELLVGKSLAALIPGVGITWLSGVLFIISLAFLSASPHVFVTIISPGWLVLFLLWSPLLALISIAVMVAISARVNDTRSAQQASIWLVVPFLSIFFGQLAGFQVLGPIFTLMVAVVLAVLAVAALWLAARIFQRETILTRWK